MINILNIATNETSTLH